MKQQLSSHQPPDDPGSSVDHESAADDVAGLESILSDAYNAPPVPKSLVKKLDEGIETQWGRSPGLGASRIAGTAALAEVGKSWFRSWPVAAGLAAVLMLAFVFGGGSGNYAWATVVDAIKRQGLIQIDQGDGVCWLDLAKRVAGRRTSQQTQWVDLRKRVVLTRKTGSSTLHREPLTISGEAGQAEPLLAAFLLGQPLSGESLDRLSGVKVVDQHWDRETSEGREIIDLRVHLQTDSDEHFSLSLRLDPKSKLPLAVQRTDGNVSTQLVSLAYPDQSSGDLQASHFPANLTVVDSSPDRIAARSPLEASETNPLGRPQLETDSTGSDGDRLGVNESDTLAESAHQVNDSNDSDDRDSLVATLPIGAANKWAAVAVVPRTDVEVLQRVDRILQELWDREGVLPVNAATELQLLRRAYLDLTGRTPTVTEVRSYLKDQGADRYERLVDSLLESPDHASQMAAVWRSFLIPEGIDLVAFGGREAFDEWLAERFAAGEPYDQIVRKLLLAEGRLSQSGPLLFYSALKLDAHQLAARTSRVFLGMRLECAQCHDHPFEPWTQEDFWSYAAFFAQISRPKGELENASTVMRVRDVDRGDVMLPETEIVVPPRFLGDQERQDSATQLTSSSARREQLAAWLTGADNPYFARATVNRVWSQLFGRGIVDPVDDFGINNQPASPELLDTLASQFISSGFDLKTLIRSVALSRAYRLSSGSDQAVESDDDVAKRLETFAQMNVKTLTAAQLYDCIAVATLLDQDKGGNSDYTLARFGNSQREAFLQQFASPAANRAEYLAGIPQALLLMNGSLITGATGESSSGLIRSLEAPFFSDRQRIDVLFMATLSRPATAEELELLAEFVPAGASATERSAGLADLLWALINSAEFTLNH